MPLRNLRRSRTINQEDFSRLVGISQQTLSKIERGIFTPSTDVQALIATILGVSRAECGFPTDQERGAA